MANHLDNRYVEAEASHPPSSRTADPAKPDTGRVWFGVAPVDTLTMEQATGWLLGALKSRSETDAPLQVMGPNAFLVTLAARNRHFARALQQASLCLPDGMSVVWGARLLGRTIPERVPGGEFFERMCASCAQDGLSVYLLGGLPGAADGAAQVLAQRYPGLRIAGTDCPPVGFDQVEDMRAQVRARIVEAKPDLLCVALGAPKQEIWMLDECVDLPIGAALSVGAALDTVAGLRKRAPAWTHNIGLEWAYRFAMEPRRLWKRYLIGNLEFLFITLRTWGAMRAKTTPLAELSARLAEQARGEPLAMRGVAASWTAASSAEHSGASTAPFPAYQQADDAATGSG